MAVTQPVIKFGIFDTTAKPEAVYSGTQIQPFVDYAVLKRDLYTPTKYASCELNSWLLNASCEVAPNDLSTGRWEIISSNVSDATGNLTESPTIEATFSTPHSSAGITLCSAEAWCPEVLIAWYNASHGEITHKTFYPDSANYFAEQLVEGFYGVKITFVKTNRPYSAMHLSRLFYGTEYIFAPEELRTASILGEISLISECLVSGQLTFTAFPDASKFDLLNDIGIFAALQSGQVITVDAIVDDVQSQLGKYYLDTWESTDNSSASFTCVDIIGLLAKRDCMGGLYFNVALQDVLTELFGNIAVTFSISPSIVNSTLTGWIPKTDCRTALQYICFALGVLAIVQPDGTIFLTPEDTVTRLTIDKTRKFTGQQIVRRQTITDVSVVAHAYAEVEKSNDLLNQVVPVGTHTLYFDKPVYGLTCTGATITSSNANYVTFEVVAEGTVNIKGYVYAEVQKTYQISREAAMPGGARTYIAASDCTLVSVETALSITQNIYNYYNLSKKVTFKAVKAVENIGNLVQVFVEDQTLIVGIISKVQLNLIGMVATYDVIGYIRDVSNFDNLQHLNVFYLGGRVLI